MPRASIVVRPGWNEAAHTDVELLHAAAYYEFKTHVESLLQRGLVAEATRLWASVCQIDHFPPHIQLGWGCRDFPLSDGHLVWKKTVGGVLSIREDSSSLGSAHGTAQLSWLCPGVTRGVRGNPTMIAWARRSWICYSSSRCGLIGRLGTLRRTTSLAWSPSSSTMPIAWSTSPNFGMCGGPGNPHSVDGGTHPWCPSRLTWLRGEHHGPEQSGRYGVGLVPWRLGRNPCHLARLVDCRHLSSVSDASPPCAAPVHPPSVQDVTPSCVETHLQQLRPSDVCLSPDDTEVWSAVSGPARTLQTLAAVVSGVAMAYSTLCRDGDGEGGIHSC